MAAPFHLDILAASVPFYRGDCVSLVLPTTDGEYGILRFETAEGEQRRAAVAPGLFKVENGRVLLLVDAAERPEDIDVNRALRAREEAEEELRQKRSMAEYPLAQSQLARAMNRLRVSGRG